MEALELYVHHKFPSKNFLSITSWCTIHSRGSFFQPVAVKIWGENTIHSSPLQHQHHHQHHPPFPHLVLTACHIGQLLRWQLCDELLHSFSLISKLPRHSSEAKTDMSHIQFGCVGGGASGSCLINEWKMWDRVLFWSEGDQDHASYVIEGWPATCVCVLLLLLLESGWARCLPQGDPGSQLTPGKRKGVFFPLHDLPQSVAAENRLGGDWARNTALNRLCVPLQPVDCKQVLLRDQMSTYTCV